MSSKSSPTKHAFNQAIDERLLAANTRCQTQHKKMTPQRREILELMLKAGSAVTAYQLIDAYREAYLKTVPPVTIYRALEFLLATGNIHRMDSSNQYMVCRHLACGHAHETPQFLICRNCASVDEVAVSNHTIQTFQQNADAAGFRIERMQFETHGLCQQCQQVDHV